MNLWKTLFKPSEILTQADRDELATLEKKTEPYRAILARIDEDFVVAMHRIGRLQELAGRLAEDPTNEKIYQRMVHTACMPSNIQTGYQHMEAASAPFQAKIEEVLRPSVEIVRRVIKRALAMAEGELKKVEGRDRKEAEEQGYNYSPSGKALALQSRILDLRNAIATKYKFEGATQDPGAWQERLREWL
jgi:hypothetical protein